MPYEETNEVSRCCWCNLENPRYVAYHDHEWGVPEHNDDKLFEILLLETFQAGLSWECILNKREAFRQAFCEFDFHKIACFDEAQVERLMQTPSIVRNRLKIRAAITNAHVFMKIRTEFGSFDHYIWQFTDGMTVRECGKSTSPLSDAVSKDLRSRGMKFVGSTVIYAFLQAIGIINSHEEDCFLYHRE